VNQPWKGNAEGKEKENVVKIRGRKKGWEGYTHLLFRLSKALRWDVGNSIDYDTVNDGGE